MRLRRIRYWIANMITEYELKRAKTNAVAWFNSWQQECCRVTMAVAQAHEATAKAYLLQEQLNRIAAMETPNCAPIGKCMAQVAREALK